MTTTNDRNRLRRLAGEYAEIFGSDEMHRQREVWRLSNRLEERTVPFQIEDNGSFFADLTPPCECEGEMERGFEAQLLRAITNYRLIDDDRIFPNFFQVQWHAGKSVICPELQYKRVPDSTGRDLGYETNTPLADLANSLHKLKPYTFSVDREGTYRTVEAAEAIFGDVLPVQIIGRQVCFAGTSLAGTAVLLMGMDTFYMAMMDQPENVHYFFDFLATQNELYMQWLEDEELITTYNHEFDCGTGSCVHTDELPCREIGPDDKVGPQDCWGFVEAQEAIGISPATYAEFIYPYQRRIGDRFGLLVYGCCEPVHSIWSSLSEFTNLRKLAVSPWCDQEAISEAVGKRMVLCRKPHPLKLCGTIFETQELEDHLQETLSITADNFVEIVY